MGHNFWGGCCGGTIWNMGGMGYFSPILSLLVTVVIIIGLAWLLISLINKVGSKQHPQTKGSSPGPGTAQEYLKTRYARGEISREEYLNILADIE